MTGADQNSISDPRLNSGSASEPPTGHELSVALTKVAAEPSSSSADDDLPKTPFLDNDGHPMLNYLGKPIMRSADRLDPYDLIAKGEALRQQMMPQPFLDSPDAAVTAAVLAYASLSNCRFAGPWDAQRLDKSIGGPGLVDYANELVGIYAKAAGLPLKGNFGGLEPADVHNMVNGGKVLADHAPGYPYLSL